MQRAPSKDDLVPVDLLNEEGLDRAALLQPLRVVDVDRVVEGALALRDCSFFAEIADGSPMAIPTPVGDHEQVNVGFWVSGTSGAGSIEPKCA